MSKKQKTIERNRRKDNCSCCLNFKPIKAKGQCQNCWHKWKRKNDKKFFLSVRYTEMKMRCENVNHKNYEIYKNRLRCDRKSFVDFFMKDEAFNLMFNSWKNREGDIRYSPSIDRIDNDGFYEIGNMQFIEHHVNCSKDQKRIRVVVTRDGVFVGEYESLISACNTLGLQQPNAWKVLRGIRKRVKGYEIKYA